MINESENNTESFNYTYVNSIARIALYDDLRSAPRIIEINPAHTNDYIEQLSSQIYEQAQKIGGTIPYTVIREVSENFIHAQFSEVVVSILDKGNTIRFADQGPGITQKDKVQFPGFSSAIEPMKKYIRGVGSGLPIVKDYLDYSDGSITIEDNINNGSVVTISLNKKLDTEKLIDKKETSIKSKDDTNSLPYSLISLIPQLNERERDFLIIFLEEDILGVTDLSRLTGTPASSTYVSLSKLEDLGLLTKAVGQKKRVLTNLGHQIAQFLLS